VEAIILAGGMGTRLRRILPDCPKPMALIGGRPFLELIIEKLATKGFNRIILSLGYLAEVIQSYFGSHFCGVALSYVVEKQPLGTGGGMRLAMQESSEDHVFVFNGDTYLDLEVNLIEAQWQVHRVPIIVGCWVPNATRYGQLLSDAGYVTGFSKKGVNGSGLINAGCYVLNSCQLNYFSPNTAFSFESDYLQKAVTTHLFELFVTQGVFIDIGVPEDYYRAQIEIPAILR